mgnify:CR=1 FL=1
MPKSYKCAFCGKLLKHDDVHQHVQHQCPKKPKR